MSEAAASLRSAATPHIEYQPLAGAEPLADNILCAVAFGPSPADTKDPRRIHVRLEPLSGAGLMEVWRANGPVRSGSEGPLRYVADSEHLLVSIEVDERDHEGIVGAAEFAYSVLNRFVSASDRPHLLRIWNYFSAINQGAGDNERYKLFCVGRAAGQRQYARNNIHPAATCIGTRDGSSVLQVYCLASRAPGMPLENPRQVSAYHYPRQYGPASPSFSRAMLVSDRLLMISGTASIVGHASQHPDDARAQLDETLANLTYLLQRAASSAPRLAPRLGSESLLKVYLRDKELAAEVEAHLRARLPDGPQLIILHADICRAELLLEADCVCTG